MFLLGDRKMYLWKMYLYICVSWSILNIDYYLHFGFVEKFFIQWRTTIWQNDLDFSISAV